MKTWRAVNKKLVTGSLTWLILLGEINYNTETPWGGEASTSRFLHSKSWLKVRDDIYSASTKLLDL